MKSKLMLFSIVTFFIFGSVSCSQEQEVEKPAPKVLTTPYLSSSAGESVDLKALITTQSSTWALSDHLNFPEIGEFTDLEISTRCQADDQESAAEFRSKIKPSFQLFQFIPVQLHTHKTSNLICSFEFKAWTRNKDRHGFSIHQLKLSPLQETLIPILNNDQSLLADSTLPLPLSQLQNYKVLFPDRTDRTTHLSCETLEFQSSISILELKSLDDFDFYTTLSTPSAATELNTKPVQRCRVLTKNEDGLIAEVSAAFELLLGPNHLKVEAQPMSVFKTDMRQAHWVTDHFRTNPGAPIINLNIVNDGDSFSYIALPKTIAAHSIATPAQGGNNARCTAFRSDALRFAPGSHIEVLAEAENRLIVRVAPKTQSNATYNLFSEHNRKYPVPIGSYLKSEILSEAFHYELLRVKGHSQEFQTFKNETISLPKTVFLGLGSESQTRQALFNVCGS